MSVRPLWTAADAAMALGLDASGAWAAAGVSIDSRSVGPGDLFVAVAGPNFDGAAYAPQAYAAGAAAIAAPWFPDDLCADAPRLPIHNGRTALEALGAAARARFTGRVAALTGSVGKTSAKDALKRILSSVGSAHATRGNLNNHLGLPLTLARTPADTDFAVYELGMNAPGEIAPLAAQVRPQAALVTAIGEAHLEAFGALSGIAEEKASIYAALPADGVAILPAEARHADILRARADGRRILTFGTADGVDARLIRATPTADGQIMEAVMLGERIEVAIAAHGAHLACTAIGALTTAVALGVAPWTAAAGLAGWSAGAGRGARTTIPTPDGGRALLIDESYNASPPSVRAALRMLAQTPATGARVAVIGDMLEMGSDGPAVHADLADALDGIDRLVTVGPMAAHLAAAAGGEALEDAAAACAAVPPMLDNGDAVLVKASNGVGLGRLAAALRG